VASGHTSPTLLASFDRHTCSWRTSPRCGSGASPVYSGTWPRWGMTRNGRAFALATSERRTAGRGSSSWRGSPPRSAACSLLPTPAAGNFNEGEALESWRARRNQQKARHRNGNGFGTPLAIAIRLLPTPDTGVSPRGHGHRGGRRGNGHQSGQRLDALVKALPPASQRKVTRPARQRTRAGSARPALLPTPQAHDAAKGKTVSQIAAMRNRGHGVVNLNELAENTRWTGGSMAQPYAGGSASSGGRLHHRPSQDGRARG